MRLATRDATALGEMGQQGRSWDRHPSPTKAKEQGGKIQIYVRKMRFKWVGGIGVATLAYDVATGTYHEPDGSAQNPFGEAAE